MKITLTIVLLFISHTLIGQNIELGKTRDLDPHFAVQGTEKLQAVTTCIIEGSISYTKVKSYYRMDNADLRDSFLTMHGGLYDYMEIKEFNDKPFLLYQRRRNLKPSKNQLNYYPVQISPDSFTFLDRKFLRKVKKEMPGFPNSDHISDIIYSPNNKYFALKKFIGGKTKKVLSLNFSLYNDQFELIGSYDVKLEKPSWNIGRFLNIQLTDEGDLYILEVLARVELLKKSFSENFKSILNLYKLSSNGKFSKTKLEEIDKTNDAVLHLNSDGSVAVAGTCGEKGDFTFSYLFDSDLQLINSDKQSLIFDIPENPPHVKDKEAVVIEFNYNSITLDKIIEAKDGSLYLLSSFHGYSDISGKYGYHHFNVYATRINPDGLIDWTGVIFKRANEGSYPRDLSYFPICDSSGISIYYTASPKSIGELPEMLYWAGEYGEEKAAIHKMHFSITGDSEWSQLYVNDGGEALNNLMIRDKGSYRDENNNIVLMPRVDNIYQCVIIHPDNK